MKKAAISTVLIVAIASATIRCQGLASGNPAAAYVAAQQTSKHAYTINSVGTEGFFTADAPRSGTAADTERPRSRPRSANTARSRARVRSGGPAGHCAGQLPPGC